MIKETMAYLSQYDPEVGATIENEYHREQRNIELIASENIVSPAVMLAMGTCLTNIPASVTTAAATALTRPRRSPVSAPASSSVPSTRTSSPTPARARTSRPSRRCSSPATPTWA